MQNSLFWVMLVGILLILLLLFLIVKKGRNNLLIAGIVVVAIIVVLVAVFMGTSRLKDDEVSISTTTYDESEKFKLDVDCKITKYEDVYAQFTTDCSLEEITDVVTKQYGDNAVIDKKNDNKVYVTYDNSVISIELDKEKKVLGMERNKYIIRSECISLEVADDEFVNIPFPKEYLNVEGAFKSEMEISCDSEVILDFYKNFTNVTVNDNVVEINQNPVVTVTISDGKVLFETK